MICNVCFDLGTNGGCWKCGKVRDRVLNNGNFACRNCGWDHIRDGDVPAEKQSGYYTIHLCPKCGHECTPIGIH